MHVQNIAVHVAPELIMDAVSQKTDNLRQRRFVDNQSVSQLENEDVLPDSLAIFHSHHSQNDSTMMRTTALNTSSNNEITTTVFEDERLGEIEGKLEEKLDEDEGPKDSRKLLPFHQLPNWLQYNEYLTDHHRPPMNSFSGCFKTMFRMHTETWNIWTHFLGFVFFVVLCLGIYVYGDYITFLFEDIEIYKLPATEQAMLFCFFLAAMICLLFSTIFHLFSNHSQTVYKIFCRLDYSGISISLAGCTIPACYYGLYCNTIPQYTHITIVGLLSILSMIISLWSKFSIPKYRPLRFAVFVSFGLYGFIPGIHVCLIEGFFEEHTIQWVTGLLTTGSINILGALFYVSQFPERFFPGRFNTWANSHQIWHMCSLLGFIVHYDTLLGMVRYRLSDESVCV